MREGFAAHAFGKPHRSESKLFEFRGSFPHLRGRLIIELRRPDSNRSHFHAQGAPPLLLSFGQGIMNRRTRIPMVNTLPDDITKERQPGRNVGDLPAANLINLQNRAAGSPKFLQGLATRSPLTHPCPPSVKL